MPGVTSNALTVVLEVEPASDPIRGIARDRAGTERPFTGWVELATALEQSLDGKRELDR
jgi:hypothetical protein